MKTTFWIIVFSCITLCATGQQKKVTPAQMKDDFNFFWKSIDEDYCYFSKRQTDWAKVKGFYSPAVDRVKTRDQFIGILEMMFYEIYDHHASLNTNTNNSQRLVPSGTDTWAEYVNEKPLITEVRKNYGTEKAGITAGMEVIAINDVPVKKAIEPFMPKSLKSADKEARNCALRLALAGNHIIHRKFTLRKDGIQTDYFPDKGGMLLEHSDHPGLVTSYVRDGIGYIKINDCLFDNNLIPAFDSAMLGMQETNGLIIDMRETPSGGNTTVARAILGWFTDRDQYYQKHELYAEEKTTGIKRSWAEIVSPRPGKYYSKPLVVLCDHWTGSVGEGIVIAFDATTKAKIIGTQMAGLNGATYSYQMPNTGIRFSFPVERLYHVNGLPREQYKPGIVIDQERNGALEGDAFLDRAYRELKK